MEERDLEQSKQCEIRCKRSILKPALWIIEHAWAQGMMDILEGVDISLLPKVDPGSVNLREAWGLRVAAAQMYSIVKNRDISCFDEVIHFLEATHKLLPRLVAPIKHMKIVFGLKTMVIMWMFREDHGSVRTVVKTIQFFPSRLPQYQDQSTSHELFIMRKYQQDFKTFALSLALDRTKLDTYREGLMEDQYGERYAQKVEERLTQYLLQLEAAMPRETYIDKLLVSKHPVTSEEELLLEVLTSDITPSSASLKMLLACVLASPSRCSPGSVSQKKSRGQGAESGWTSSPNAALKGTSHQEETEERERRRKETTCDLSKDSPLLFEEESEETEDVIRQRAEKKKIGHSGEKVLSQRRTQEEEEEVDQMRRKEVGYGELEVVEENSARGGKCVSRTQEEEDREPQQHKDKAEDLDSSHSKGKLVRETSFPPLLLCSKHQRWVRSILQECSEECSEDPESKEDEATTSPMLFMLSSSTSSSQDLTASFSIPSPSVQDHSPRQTSTTPPEADQESPRTAQEVKHHSGTSGERSSNQQPQPLSQHSKNTPAVTPSLPEVALKPSATSDEQSPTLPPEPAASGQFFNAPVDKQAVSDIKLQSAVEKVIFTVTQVKTPPNPTNTMYTLVLTNSPSAPPPTHPTSTILIHNEHWQQSQSPTDRLPVTHPQTDLPSTSVSCRPAPQNSYSRLSRKSRRPQVPHPPTHGFLSNQSASDRRRAKSLPITQLRLSLQSQDLLFQSKLLQPYVRLTRKSRPASSAVPHPQEPHQPSYGLLPKQSEKAPTSLQTDVQQPLRTEKLSGLPRQASPFPPGSESWCSMAKQVNLSMQAASKQATHCLQPNFNPFLSLLPDICRLPTPVAMSHNPPQPETLPCSAAILPSSMSDRRGTKRLPRAQLRLSLQSQDLLFQSNLLQPNVRLTRFNQEECNRVTEGRSSARSVLFDAGIGKDNSCDGDEEREDAGEDLYVSYSQFDVDNLDSSEDSQNSDDDDSDPDYIPPVKRRCTIVYP